MPEAPLDIIPRDLRFGLVENADPAWFEGDVLRSAIMDGFAVSLPEGERFFIRSLRHYLDRIEDPAVRQDIQGYAVQEGHHAREHAAYNAALRRLGVDVDALEAPIRARFARVEGPMMRLLITCAIEQLTYALSHLMLSRDDIMRNSRPAYRRLWTWHAVEELEHSAVALRVLREVTKGMPRWRRYAIRVGVFNGVLVNFVRISAHNIVAIAANAGVKGRWRNWLRGLWLMFGYPGYLRRALPALLAYYRPGYLGARRGDEELLRRGRARLAAELAAG
jgi:predicted metal-dependent hydrolase